MTLRRRHAARSLDDARNRDGINHGLTDSGSLLRQRGRSQTASVRQLLVCRGRSRDNPASSARFTQIHRRCRNRSSPCPEVRECSSWSGRCHTVELSMLDAGASEHHRIQRMPHPRHSRSHDRIRPPCQYPVPHVAAGARLDSRRSQLRRTRPSSGRSSLAHRWPARTGIRSIRSS